MKEDDVYVEPSKSIWVPSRPQPFIVAACAALACAPDSQEGLFSATESSLRNLEYDNLEHGRHIIQTLKILGWLESDGRWLYTAHDVVADEVLDQVIFEKELIREKELEAVLSCSIERLRPLGRFATALNRLIGSKEKEAAKNLQMASENWLIQNASALGQLAKETDTDVASYALGAVLAGSPWNETVIQTWANFIAPWLDHNSQKLVARHLLYKGLKNIDETETSIALKTTSINWLHENGEDILASFVLTSLLARTDLEGEEAKKSVTLAVSWLDKHNETLDAGAEFVLKHLLPKEQLPEAQKNKLIRVSLERIRTNLENDEASFLIRSCMRSWLNDDKLTKDLFDVAILWLKAHPRHSEKDYVFNKLLRRSRLVNSDWTQVAKIALNWLKSMLEDHSQRDHAISSLHRRGAFLLDSTDFEYLLDQTIKWFKEHKDTEQAFSGLLKSLRETFRELDTHHQHYRKIKELIESNVDEFQYYRQLLIDQIGKSEELVDADIVRNALSEFKKRTAYSPASAGYMIPALLAIAVRLESELAYEIQKNVYDTISDARYKDIQKRGMLRECLQMIKDGKFHPKEKALLIIKDVGLKIDDDNRNMQEI